MPRVVISAAITLILSIGCRKEQPAVTVDSSTSPSELVGFFAEENERQQKEARSSREALLAEVAGRADAAATPLRAHWRQFRNTFPFHTQALALSAPEADGSRTLVVAEPPPHVKTADILVPLAPVLRRHRLEKQTLGFDGSVTDVVVAVAGTEEAIATALSTLHQTLFFTSYKAHVFRMPVRPTRQRYELDLDVTTEEIRTWLMDKRESLTPVEGGAAIAAPDVFGVPASTVYRSERGLIAWWVPAGVEIDACRVEARQFALDSDIVIGGIGKSTGTLLVARERVVPVDLLPPLRFETIALLASVQSSSKYELHQSYERNAPFAGRFDEKRDWAPILLSPELRDTEYGSLLNITDQLLKGWSNGGHTNYVNFNYPRPPKYPFAAPLQRQLGATSLTYNWNTRGAAYAVDLGDSKVVALNRSGALPVSYFPDETDGGAPTPEIIAAEETAYEYFSTLSDPNLVRVVQYAALYQIFAAYDIRNRPLDSAGGEYASQRLEELTNALGKEIETADEKRQLALAKMIAPTLAEIFDTSVAQAEAAVLLYFDRYRESSERADEFVPRTILSLIAGVTDLPRRYADDVAKKASGWVHTPAVVVSWNHEDPMDIIIGGHNLGAEVTDVVVSPRAARGLPEVDAKGRILVHTDDAARICRAIRPASRLKDKSPALQQRELTEILRRIPEAPPRSVRHALRLDTGRQAPRFLPMPEPPATRSARRVGWSSSDVRVAAPEAGSGIGAQVVVERRGDVYLIAGTGLDPIEAYTKPDVADAIVTLLRRRQSDEAISIDLRNFRQHEGMGLVRECEVRLASVGKRRSIAGLLRTKALDDGAIGRMRAQRYDFSQAKVESRLHETPNGVEGQLTIAIPRVAEPVVATAHARVKFAKGTSRGAISRIISMIVEEVRTILTEMRGAADTIRFNLRLSQALKRIRQETGVEFDIIDQQFREGTTDVDIVRDGGRHGEHHGRVC